MTIIKNLAEKIKDELEDAEDYAKRAIKHKDDDRELAQAFYELSTEELRHANLLHEQVVRFIKRHRAEKGEPPAAMQAVWDYLHEEHIEEANEVRLYLEQFKNS